MLTTCSGLANARTISQNRNFVANDGLYSIRRLFVARFLDKLPDRYKIGRRQGREDVATLLSI